MYLDIKNIKAIRARAIGSKIGSDIIEPIMNAIKDVAANGNDMVKIIYDEYNINKNNRKYLSAWATTCGFSVSIDKDCIYIMW